jgi:hypothetical protein
MEGDDVCSLKCTGKMKENAVAYDKMKDLWRFIVGIGKTPPSWILANAI